MAEPDEREIRQNLAHSTLTNRRVQKNPPHFADRRVQKDPPYLGDWRVQKDPPYAPVASSQLIASGSRPETRYSSTSPMWSGTRTAMSDARLPASMLPNASPNPSAFAPHNVALS